jgi:hypothetical protein
LARTRTPEATLRDQISSGCSWCALTKGADDAHRLFAVELDSKDNAAERAFAPIRLINKYFSA